ncbi:MAG: hypothetical protein Q4C34_00460 [Bacteroidales bacterium]|nr:hypothetical protein [Bacteroidales bacterium]
MASIFIYAGLGIMLVGAAYGIYVAVKGLETRKGDSSKPHPFIAGFQFGPVSPEMRRLITVWGVIMIVGLIVTGIGVAIGLN